MSDPKLAALRLLHAPELSGWSVVCSGCPGDYENGPPEWPCGSAEILFDGGEQDELLAVFEPAIEAYRQEQRDRRQRVLDSGTPSERLMLKVTDELLAAMLRPSPYYTAFADGKKSVSIPISNEVLRDNG